MIARAPSTEQALAKSLGMSTGRVLVRRACPLTVTLPSGLAEAAVDEPVDAVVTAMDAASLEAAEAQLDAIAKPTSIAWVMPIVRPGVVGWALARARRLGPVPLEDACDALRRRGVVDVQITEVEGRLPIVVLSGRTTIA